MGQDQETNADRLGALHELIVLLAPLTAWPPEQGSRVEEKGQQGVEFCFLTRHFLFDFRDPVRILNSKVKASLTLNKAFDKWCGSLELNGTVYSYFLILNFFKHLMIAAWNFFFS